MLLAGFEVSGKMFKVKQKATTHRLQVKPKMSNCSSESPPHSKLTVIGICLSKHRIHVDRIKMWGSLKIRKNRRPKQLSFVCIQNIYLSIYTYICTLAYIYIYLNIHMYICIYGNNNEYIYIYTLVSQLKSTPSGIV